MSDERDKFIRTWTARAAELGISTTLAKTERDALDAAHPTGRTSRLAAIVSLGNDSEGHGGALSPDVDDRTGQAIAIAVANQTGARYLGHAPYATDGIGDLAAQWSPAYLPVDTFVDKTVDYIAFLIKHTYDARGHDKPALVALISGHGGNAAVIPHLEQLAQRLGVQRVTYDLALVAPEDADTPPIQHAADAEHALARHIGPALVDEEKLAALEAPRDEQALIELLVKEPALGGMAGYYLFGDAAFDAVRARYSGIKTSVRDFLQRGHIHAPASIGVSIHDHSVKVLSERLHQRLAES